MSDDLTHNASTFSDTRIELPWRVGTDNLPATLQDGTLDHRWILTVSKSDGPIIGTDEARELLTLIDDTAYATLSVRKQGLIRYGLTGFDEETTRMGYHLKSIIASLNLARKTFDGNVPLLPAELLALGVSHHLSDSIRVDGHQWFTSDLASLHDLDENIMFLVRPPLHVPEGYDEQRLSNVLSRAAALHHRYRNGDRETLNRFSLEAESELDEKTQLASWLVARERYEITQEILAILRPRVQQLEQSLLQTLSPAEREETLEVLQDSSQPEPSFTNRDIGVVDLIRAAHVVLESLSYEVLRPGPVGTTGDQGGQPAEADPVSAGYLAVQCERMLAQVLSDLGIPRPIGDLVPQSTDAHDGLLAAGATMVFREVQERLQSALQSSVPSDFQASQSGEQASIRGSNADQGVQTDLPSIHQACQTTEQGRTQTRNIDHGLQTVSAPLISRACQTIEQTATQASYSEQGCQTDILPSISQGSQTTEHAIAQANPSDDNAGVEKLTALLSDSRLSAAAGNQAGKAVAHGIARATTVDQDNPLDTEGPVAAGPSGTSGTGRPATGPADHGNQTETPAGDSRIAESEARRLRRQDRRRDRTWNATE